MRMGVWIAAAGGVLDAVADDLAPNPESREVVTQDGKECRRRG
jgi:hypothetical protein